MKEFAYDLAPLIEDLYNQSLREGAFPSLLKASIVTPVPKVNPPNHIESDVRPISLTCTLAKVLEGFTCSRLLSQLDGKIDVRQYARKGHSTTDALLYMLQAKKLYSLRILRRAGVDRESILRVYLTTIRPIMEYAVLVWQSIPVSLSDKLESVQRRALKIIYPAERYNNVLQRAQIASLSTRRHQLCVKYMDKIRLMGPSLLT